MALPVPASASRSQSAGIGMALLAVVCFSTAPVFVLAANSVFSPVEIAFWRVAIGTGFVGVLGLISHISFRLERGQWRRFAGYGFFLALHLVAYIAAIRFTSIAHAVALTYTSPIWIAILGAIFLRERPTLLVITGLIIGIAGVAVLSGFQPEYGRCDIATGQCTLLGDGLAIVAAICASLYAIAGRIESTRHPLFRYTFYVYGWAALWLLPLSLWLGLQHAYTLPAIGAVAALGLIPLGMGHTLYNAAIRRAAPTVVNMLATQEITGGILLGMLFYHQYPTTSAIVGILITLVGIGIVILAPVRSQA